MAAAPLSISVILPTYNTEDFLDQALTSVREQTYPHLEILCINDGSTDGSLAIMNRHAQEDSRIRVVDKKNEGYGATCNRGIREATGSYLSIIEPDDWIEPTMYADLTELIESFDEPVDVAKSAYWRITDPDTPKQRKLHCSYHGRIQPTQQPCTLAEMPHLLLHHPSIWSALYRKEFLIENDIWFNEYPGAGWADNPFLIATLCQAKTIAYLDKAYYCYREDTEERERAFMINQALLPFERWEDMMDILEALEVEDPGILAAHNNRGFTYYEGVVKYHDHISDDLQQAIDSMFARMDADLVLGDAKISPSNKMHFLESRGLPAQDIDKTPYRKTLVNEFFYSTKNNGLGFAFRMVRDYLKS